MSNSHTRWALFGGGLFLLALTLILGVPTLSSRSTGHSSDKVNQQGPPYSGAESATRHLAHVQDTQDKTPIPSSGAAAATDDWSASTVVVEKLAILTAARQAQLGGFYASLSDLLSNDAGLARREFADLAGREGVSDEASILRADVNRLLRDAIPDRALLREIVGIAFAHVLDLTDPALVEVFANWLREQHAHRATDSPSVLATVVATFGGATLEQNRLRMLFGESRRDLVWAVGGIDARAMLSLLSATGVPWVEAAEIVYAPERCVIAPFETISWLEKEREPAVLPYLNRLHWALEAPVLNPMSSPHPRLKPAVEDAIERLGGHLPSLDEAIQSAIESADPNGLARARHTWKRFVASECSSLNDVTTALLSILAGLPDDEVIIGSINWLLGSGGREYWRVKREHLSESEYARRCHDDIQELLDLLVAERDPWRLFTLGGLLSSSIVAMERAPSPQQVDGLIEHIRDHLDDVPPGIDPFRSIWSSGFFCALLAADLSRGLEELYSLIPANWDTDYVTSGAYDAIVWLAARVAAGLAVLTQEQTSLLSTLADLALAEYVDSQSPDDWGYAMAGLRIVGSLRLRTMEARLVQVRDHATELGNTRIADYAERNLTLIRGPSEGE